MLPVKCKKNSGEGTPPYIRRRVRRAAPRQVFSCWQPRRTGRSCRQGVQLPHSCPATCSWTSDYWNGTDIACIVNLSRIDYCNSLLYGARVAVVDKLQRAQNNVARVICQQRRSVHAQPLLQSPKYIIMWPAGHIYTLQSLQCLPVQQRIQYKIAVTTHKALSTSVPPYIDELLQHQLTTRSLRSTDAPRLSVPWTRTETAKRAFCMAAPNAWNGIVDFLTPVCCQPSMPNWKRTMHIQRLLRTRDEHTHLRASVLTFS